MTRRIFIKNSSCQAESFGASGLTKDAFVLFLNEVHSLHVILEELSRVEIDSSISLMDYSLWNEKCNVFH